MTTNRSYQRAHSAYEALQIMKSALADKFDQQLLVEFIRMLRASPGAAAARIA